MLRRWPPLACLSLTAVLACSHVDSGAAHAFRIRDAQFFEGELPGTAAGDAGMPDSSAADGVASQGPPRITSVETSNLNVFQGQGGKAFRGRASKDASSIAITLKGAEPHAGYWVLPLGAPDPSTDELTWSAVADFDPSIVAGKHALQIVAIDEQGRAGMQLAVELCITGLVPDNGSACYANKPPPRAVISLQWDVNADLDLQVIEPGGRVVDSQHPSDAAAADGGMASAAGATAVIDRDSNAGCTVDGLRTENMIWNSDAPDGSYAIYVNLFDACKQPSVRFKVSVYTSDGGNGSLLTQRFQKYGELLDIAADPRAVHGLFVGEFAFDLASH